MSVTFDVDIVKECLPTWVHLKILETLMRKPRAMSQRQLAQIAGIPRATAQRALVDLGQTGLIKPHTVGSATYWEIDRRGYLYEMLEPVLKGLDAVIPPLKYLKTLIQRSVSFPKGTRCFVFGSAIEGGGHPSTVIAMALILSGTLKTPSSALQENLDALQDACREKFGKRLGIIFVNARDLPANPEKDLYRNILKGMEVST